MVNYCFTTFLTTLTPLSKLIFTRYVPAGYGERSNTGRDDEGASCRDDVHIVSTSGRKRRRTFTVSKEKTEAVFAFVQSHPGTRSTEITAGTSISQSTVERCLAELRKQGRVAYVGSKKNGGYEAV